MQDKIKVLMIDDDTTLGEVVTTCLKADGYETQYAATLSALEGMVKTFQSQIIVLDIEVGDGDGIEEMKRLNRYAPDIPVIFISSHIETSTAVKALNAGGMTFLRKPFDVLELEAYISKYAKKQEPASSCVEIGRLHIDNETHVVTLPDGRTEHLPLMAWKALMLLIRNFGRTTTRDMLRTALWPEGYGSNAGLDNILSRLRKIISADGSLEIVTIPKTGFELKARSQAGRGYVCVGEKIIVKNTTDH